MAKATSKKAASTKAASTKAASTKAAKSEAPKAPAKKAPAKKAPARKAPARKKAAAAEPAATAITEADWTQIYAKAWADDAFRTLLETDPTAALRQYAAENGLQWTALVTIPPAPQGAAAEEENCIHLVSCC
jgi:hypothetical protein